MCVRCRVVRAVDLKFLALWNTTACSVVDDYEIVGLHDPDIQSTGNS